MLNASTIKNPMVVICNYIFDTLKQDAFRIVEGELQQALCTVISDQHEENPIHPDVIRRIRCAHGGGGGGGAVVASRLLAHAGTAPVLPAGASGSIALSHQKCMRTSTCRSRLLACLAPRVTPPSLGCAAVPVCLCSMLRYYVTKHRNASILVPIGGILMMKNLAKLTGGRLLVLCGDKAYAHEEELAGLRDPHVAIHGSFSFMVNFHSVSLFVNSRGGVSLQTPYLDGFKVRLLWLLCANPRSCLPPAATLITLLLAVVWCGVVCGVWCAVLRLPAGLP